MLTQKRLKELFHYNPETGVITRKIKVRGRFGEVGSVVGSLRKKTGYISASVDGKLYQAHRIIWLFMTGDMPTTDVDHINRDRSDNRWDNLRLATRAQNMWNCYEDAGATYCKATGRYASAIKVNGKRIWLGRHNTEQEAKEAYRLAAIKYHGEYVCLN